MGEILADGKPHNACLLLRSSVLTHGSILEGVSYGSVLKLRNARTNQS